MTVLLTENQSIPNNYVQMLGVTVLPQFYFVNLMSVRGSYVVNKFLKFLPTLAFISSILRLF